MLHAVMASVTVHVVPRAGEASVSRDGVGRLVVRVRAVPEGGRATEEARRALARAIGVAPSRIALRSGRRARTKVFAIEGMADDELSMRLRTTPRR